MNDAGQSILIDIISSPIAVFEQGNGATRYVLGYISGEFSKNLTTEDLYVKIWFKRGVDMTLESVTYKLNNGQKVFRQRVQASPDDPQGLTVTTCYVELYGWITSDFELTAFELSIKEISIGKFGGALPLSLQMDSPIVGGSS